MIEFLIILAVVTFFRIRGFPKRKMVYRILFILLSLVGLVASADFAISYSIDSYYFRGPDYRYELVFSAIGILIFAICLGEAVILTRFKTASKKEANQVPEPTSGLAPGRGSS